MAWIEDARSLWHDLNEERRVRRDLDAHRYCTDDTCDGSNHSLREVN